MEMPDFVPYTTVKPVSEALDELVRFYLGDSFQLAELLVGEEVTVFVRNGVVGVATSQGTFPAGDIYSTAAIFLSDSDLATKLVEFEQHVKKPFVIQGYFVGPAFEGNYYELEENKFVVTNIIDLEERYQLSGKDVSWFLRTYNENPTTVSKLSFVPSTVFDIPFAPAARKIAMAEGSEAVIDQVKTDLMDDFAVVAKGLSTFCPTKNRAGLVFRSTETDFVFKIEEVV